MDIAHCYRQVEVCLVGAGPIVQSDHGREEKPAMSLCGASWVAKTAADGASPGCCSLIW